MRRTAERRHLARRATLRAPHAIPILSVARQPRRALRMGRPRAYDNLTTESPVGASLRD
jgi:hypothetical protein